MKIRIFDSNRRNEPKSGYGLMSTQISANLSALGHDVCFFPRNGETEDVALWIRPPHYIEYPEFNDGKKNVFFTMHELETFDGWKKNWPELLNRCDAIIVPTEWNRMVFLENGVTKPIHVIPLGVNSKDFHGGKTYHFSMLTLHDALGSTNSRENWKETIEAYYKAFSSFNAQVSLTIKSYNIKRQEFYDFVKTLKEKYNADLPIDIVEIDMTTQTLNSLYSTHWLFIKNADREGWSLPLLEAVSCGLPVAYTDIPALSWVGGYKKSFYFFAGDIEGLANIMKEQYHNWVKEKSFVNSLSWKETTKKVEEVLKNV